MKDLNNGTLILEEGASFKNLVSSFTVAGQRAAKSRRGATHSYALILFVAAILR